MAKYLNIDYSDKGLNNFFTKELTPHVHVIWEGDFMGICKHDIPCQVCFDNSAVIERDVSIGKYSSSIQPCGICQEKGYKLIKLPKVLRRFFKF